jgi:hypothetical protein
MSREQLSKGYVQLMDDLYQPAAYFDRLDDLFIAGRVEIDRAWRQYAARHPWQRQWRHVRRALTMLRQIEAAGKLEAKFKGMSDYIEQRLALYRNEGLTAMPSQVGETIMMHGVALITLMLPAASLRMQRTIARSSLPSAIGIAKLANEQRDRKNVLKNGQLFWNLEGKSGDLREFSRVSWKMRKINLLIGTQNDVVNLIGSEASPPRNHIV